MKLQPEYLLGMLFATLSLLISTSALLIQKYSAKVEAGRVWYKRWRLFAGVIINTGSEVTLSPFAIYFAPVSLIAPLSGLGLVFNAILTHFVRRRVPAPHTQQGEPAAHRRDRRRDSSAAFVSACRCAAG